MTIAFVLLSGGVDSAVCLQEALQTHQNVEAIHIDYGQQTSDIERKNASKQAREADIPLHECDYRNVFQLFAEGTVKDQTYDSETPVAEGHSVGYVPQRNLHFLTSAAAIAEHNTPTGEDIVLYHGAQRNDRDTYPDCRPEFIEAAQEAIDRSTDQHDIRIETPVQDLLKTGVLQRGEELGVNWQLTFSCYNDVDGRLCGECPACLERSNAFDEAGIIDPLTAG